MMEKIHKLVTFNSNSRSEKLRRAKNCELKYRYVIYRSFNVCTVCNKCDIGSSRRIPKLGLPSIVTEYICCTIVY